MKLYKYYSVNKDSLSSLINKHVWYSSPDYFNDPFDTKIIENDLLQNLSFQREKIFCLSAINNNLLMWSHYADSHKGFCIEFTEYTIQKLELLKSTGIYPNDAPNNKLGIAAAKKVQYKNTVEINEILKDIPLDSNDFMQLYNKLNNIEQKALVKKIQETSYIKHKNWGYEEEYRLINTVKNIQCFPGEITAIYFGMKMTAIDKRAVGMLVAPEGSTHCNLFQMYRPAGQYSLKHKKFDVKSDLEDIDIAFETKP